MDKVTAVEKIQEILEKVDSGSLKEYQEACEMTARKDFETPKEEIMTWGLGVTGEAGDVASCIKKTFMHDNDQKEGIKENIGDVMWYIAMICNFFDWDMQKILDGNVEKLKKRYPEGFSEKNAGRNGTMVDWNEKGLE